MNGLMLKHNMTAAQKAWGSILRQENMFFCAFSFTTLHKLLHQNYKENHKFKHEGYECNSLDHMFVLHPAHIRNVGNTG